MATPTLRQVDCVYVVGDFNSVGLSSRQLEEATGLHKLTCETHTHDIDGCIEHGMRVCVRARARVRARDIRDTHVQQRRLL